MSLWECLICGCKAIAGDLLHCPACYEEKTVAKNTTGGYSDKTVPAPDETVPEPEASEHQLPDEHVVAEAEPEPVQVHVQEPEPDAPADDDEQTDYNAYAVRDLIDLCKERGIAYSGPNGTLPKADLVAKLSEQETGA